MENSKQEKVVEPMTAVWNIPRARAGAWSLVPPSQFVVAFPVDVDTPLAFELVSLPLAHFASE